MPLDGLGCTRATMIETEIHSFALVEGIDASKDGLKGWRIYHVRGLTIGIIRYEHGMPSKYKSTGYID